MKPEETIDYHVKYTWHSIANFYNRIAAQYDLSQATGYVLLNIDSEKGTPATSIAPMMGMKTNSLSRVLKNMEDAGLIFRKKSDADRRLVNIHLTKLGRDKKLISKKVVREFNDFIKKQLSEEKQKIFFEVMNEIVSLTEEYKKIKKLD